jgi:hypothetical protein
LTPAPSSFAALSFCARIGLESRSRALLEALDAVNPETWLNGAPVKMESGQRAIDKIHKRRDRYEIPDWQRGRVWGTPRKQLLVDSILRGWKLPKFYFLQTSDDPESYEVVDGQQRLNAIFDFFTGDLRLSKDSAREFGAEYYRDLPSGLSDAFDDFEIEFDVVVEAEEAEVKQFFQRLQRGLSLTGSEQLNAVPSKLRDFVLKLTKHSFFQNKVSASDTRYGFFDIVSKVAAIEIEGIDAGLRFDDLKATFDGQANFSDKSNVAKRLQGTFDLLDSVFPERSRALRNRTVVQAFATLTARLLATGKTKGHEARLRDFFESFVKELSRQVELGQQATDLEYIQFQRTVNANVRRGARTRQEILLRKLMMFDSSFVDLLDPAAIAESGLSGSVRVAGEAIASLVTQINERYSSEKGGDLFKLTNKTAAALRRIGAPIADFNEYKTLIQDLYFVFHEGVGNRLDGHAPTSFADINALRTRLQHDLDHGDAKKAAAKRRSTGQVFKKYAGSTSPESIAPEKFALVQANLLKAIETDLRSITWPA